MEKASEIQPTKNDNLKMKNNNESNAIKPITKTQVMGRNRGAVLRLQQDYINLNKDPVPYIRCVCVCVFVRLNKF